WVGQFYFGDNVDKWVNFKLALTTLVCLDTIKPAITLFYTIKPPNLHRIVLFTDTNDHAALG
ncbi:hypothetical protein, partial [Vibrio thalassae]|uniref:hypothetical protein n=1 Tax=Vibrio thalassae TaxID=1243014 RepID=UPI003640DD9C